MPIINSVSPIGTHYSSLIPSNCRQLKYLQSNGSQYMDIDFYATPSDEIHVRFKKCDTGDENASVLGACNDDRRYYTRIFMYAISRKAVVAQVCATQMANSVSAIYEPFEVTDIIARGSHYTLGGINYNNLTPIETTGTSHHSLILFAMNIQGTPATYSRTQIHYVRIYRQHRLIVDMTPILDHDGIPCMYDKTRKEFFYASSNDFIYE